MGIRTVLRAALGFLAPRVQCMACEKNPACGKEGLCQSCLDSLKPLIPGCPVCGEPGPRQICGRCSANPPAFQKANCLYPHEGTAKTLIALLKFRGEFDLPAELFAEGLEKLTREEGIKADCVVPVPSGLRHLLKNGYNQALVLSRRLSARLRVPCVQNALKRKGFKRSQVGLSAEERLENIKGQYGKGRQVGKLRGKTVLLIDDVFTTGATARACAQVLMRAGAKEVYVLCATRSVKRNQAS